jgi:hypothetical protein
LLAAVLYLAAVELVAIVVNGTLTLFSKALSFRSLLQLE